MKRLFLTTMALCALMISVPAGAQGRRPGGGMNGGNRPSSSSSVQQSPSRSSSSSSQSSRGSSVQQSPSRPSSNSVTPSRPSSSGSQVSRSDNRMSGQHPQVDRGSSYNRGGNSSRPAGSSSSGIGSQRPGNGGGGNNGGNRSGNNSNLRIDNGNRYSGNTGFSIGGNSSSTPSKVSGQPAGGNSRFGGNNGGNGDHNRPGNGGVNNGGGDHNRPGNGGGVNNGGGNHNRPGNGGFNGGGNHNRPGNGGGFNGGGNHNRPGNGGFNGGGNHNRPGGPHGGINHGGPRPDYNRYRYTSSFRPRGPHDRWFDHYRYNRWSWRAPIAPPHRPWRPRLVWYYRPTLPIGFRIYASAPVITGVLGLEFGTFLDASLNYLYYNGYNIDGYQDNVVYLRDVNMMGYSWPDVMLQYDSNGGMCYAEFATSSVYQDNYRFNALYRNLCSTYGTPINSGSGYYSWYGGNGTGYVNLNFAYEDGRYFTVLTFGN